jgi:hypothetical protein
LDGDTIGAQPCPDRIVITDADRRIAGFAPSTRYRPEPADRPETADRRVGWRGYLPASLTADMTAYAPWRRAPVPRGICACLAYWTAPAAKRVLSSRQLREFTERLDQLRFAGEPPFDGETWTSDPVAGGELRIGPVTARPIDIGPPVVTDLVLRASRCRWSIAPPKRCWRRQFSGIDKLGPVLRRAGRRSRHGDRLRDRE